MKEKKKIEVKKVVLNIKGKEISLTLDEINELRNELDKLKEKEYVSQPWYPVNIPYNRPYWDSTPNITCGPGTLTTNTFGNNASTAYCNEIAGLN